MIIITGTVQGRPDSIDELIAASLEHVHRSRAEPGCISHAVHRDVEDENRLIFVEQWADLDAVRAHFAVPESAAFVVAAGKLATARPTMHLYQSEETSV
ncbi:MAG: antibiotic biosynthesis monooxygenase [Actinomycetota bacterium]|nr:antibiotic biosynthesis monooxygenase [Actinomycetota bacterium]